MTQDWEAAYANAMLETDRKKLAVKIGAATEILQSWLSELSGLPEHARQRERIEDALRTLDMLRRIEPQVSA
ncbi:MAG TPA: hypothetical protein VJO35_11670 [Terriglobales bacterium]|nr:hypothetical protein [Terriglobales bacterium]